MRTQLSTSRSLAGWRTIIQCTRSQQQTLVTRYLFCFFEKRFSHYCNDAMPQMSPWSLTMLSP